ncbi:hypothetical protein [Roseiflexus castenholzii]|uniref:Glycosyltransferase RgtA/B/C/D-like domain-containing protein n=1 Tax=Roseiflexus castenholzii (strain DSM 13941 / HLO8) TaxID=383372 RepID=A7NQQ5_ROSCS|nr:hypothetical protein [Roseiflexus castenholzii]ABU59901.1 conserved hypothetical protein [Roseiflexus castenholzii DSM 13941]
MRWLSLQSARITSSVVLDSVLLLLLAILPLILGARLARLDQRLSVEDSNARRVLVGFYDVERNPTDLFRWSRPEAALFLFGFDGRPARVMVRLAAPRDTADPPVLSVSMRGRPVGAFAVAPGWRCYYLLTPTDPAGDTPLLLRTAAYRPPDDGRDLGVALAEFAAWPITGSAWLPPPIRTIFLVSFPFLIWLIFVWHAPHRASGATLLYRSTVALLSIAGGGAAAFPAEAGYLLPTVGWPWWPLLPLALALAWRPVRLLLARTAKRLRATGISAAWGGAALALALIVALRLGLPPLAGMSGLVAAVALTILALYRDEGLTFPAEQSMQRNEVLALAVVTVAALALRLYRLDDLPSGMWRDEARHGLLALRIWSDSTYRPVYVVAGADLPALLFYLMAPVLALTGPGVGAARLVSALAGALMPLALWWAARPILGGRAALYGAAFLAWASWGLSMSRWAFPATLDHLLELTAIGVMWRALGQPAPWRAAAGMALAGALAALAAYAYHTGRLAPLVFVALTAVRLGRDAGAWRRALPALGAAATAGVIVLLPLLAFIAGDFEGYNRRTGMVAISNAQNLEKRTVALVLDNIARYLGMWHIAGDPNGRHHAPGAPMLDPLAGTCFALGVGLALVGRRSKAFVPLLWLGLALIPGVLSTNAPHAMRSLGALAPSCMLAGMALDTLIRATNSAGSHLWRRIAPAVVTGTLVVSLSFNAWLYFVAMPGNPAVYNEFDQTETAVGRVARMAATSNDPRLRSIRVFVDRRLIERDTVRFLTGDLIIGVFDGVRLSETVTGDALLILPPDVSDGDRKAALEALGLAAHELTPPLLPNGEAPLFLAYGVGDGTQRLLNETFSPDSLPGGK